MDMYVEAGPKRTFAGALDWPGWARSGRDEAAAIQALLAYAPRYAVVARRSGLPFEPPTDVADLAVVERLGGGAGTDFGVPGQVPSIDLRPLDQADLARLEAILRAAWESFDESVASASGAPLRSGPRGGGRDLGRIVDHVVDAEGGYLRALGAHVETDRASATDGPSVSDRLATTRASILAALEASVGVTPSPGPRGGRRWYARYFVRREAWHVLDHAWEIEDRSRP